MQWKTLGFGILGIGVSLSIAAASGWAAFSVNAQARSTKASVPSQSDRPSSTPSAPGLALDPVTAGMLKLAEISSTDVLYVLGSRDGKLAIAALNASQPRRIVVVENNADDLRLLQERAEKVGVADRIQFLQQDPLQTDFREASVVALYVPPEAAQQLRSRFIKQLKPGTRIVSHTAQMGDWKPDKSIPLSRSTQPVLYHWVVPARIAGEWQGSLEYAPGRRHPYTLRFTQQFQNVKGDVIVDGQKYAIPQIALTGDRLTFSRSETIQGQKMTAVFNGRIQGNTLKGIADLDAGILSRKFPIIAKRSSGQASR